MSCSRIEKKTELPILVRFNLESKRSVVADGFTDVVAAKVNLTEATDPCNEKSSSVAALIPVKIGVMANHSSIIENESGYFVGCCCHRELNVTQLK